MSLKKKKFIFTLLALCSFFEGMAQNDNGAERQKWTLQNCIDYALSQNINLQRNKISLEQSKINTLQAKAQWYPSLSFSTNHSTNGKSYNGSYNLSASWLVFNGFRRKNTIAQQELQELASALNVSESELEMKLSIVSNYIQILYAQESIKTNKNSLETSQVELDRGNQLLKAGSISKSDLSQIEAQVAADKYQVVLAENNLEEMKLQLKQQLELGLDQDFDIPEAIISDEAVMALIPDKNSIYNNAKIVNPSIKGDSISLQIAEIETKKAKGAYYPTINLSAGVNTGHNSASDDAIGSQVDNNFSKNVGISLNYPIFDNRERKSALQKAKLNQKAVQLEVRENEKKLEKTIEGAYLDVISAQQSFLAAKENLASAEASYELVEQKYNYGMKSPFELLTEKNKLQNRQQALLQAKYMALLNIQVLNIYQDLPIDIITK